MFNFFATGNLTRDAVAREFNGRFAISMSIAINKKVKDKDFVTYLNLTYWAKSDKIVQYLKKGKRIAVTGDWYSNTKGSNDVYYQDFAVRELRLLGGNESGANNAGNAPQSNFSTQNNTNNQNNEVSGQTEPYNPFADEEEDDLPF